MKEKLINSQILRHTLQSHRERWLTEDTPWGNGHSVPEQPASEEETQRANLSSYLSGDIKYTLSSKPFHCKASVLFLHH